MRTRLGGVSRRSGLISCAAPVLVALMGLVLTLVVLRDLPGGGGAPTVLPADRATTPYVGPSPRAHSSQLSDPHPGQFDIYRLLPFSQRQVATAAGVTRRFAAAYATYRYDEEPGSYARRLAGLATAQLSARLTAAEATAGIREQRQRDKVSAVGAAQLTSIRDFGPSTVIFVVAINQQVSRRGLVQSLKRLYAITVAADRARGWLVHDLAPAEDGQAGDTG